MSSLGRAGALLLVAAGAGAWFWLDAGGLDESDLETRGAVRELHAEALEPSRRVALDARPAERLVGTELGGHARAVELARRNTAGVEALERGELDEAVRLFESCVAGEPEQVIFQRNLAEALARRAAHGQSAGDPAVRERALADLRRALEVDPTRSDLEGFLERWQTSRDAEQDFWRKETEHFELSFDGTRDELMWGTAPLENELEAAYHEFGELFGTFPVEEGRSRIRVVLYRPETFGDVTGLDDWAAGAFDGTVRVPVEDLGRETETLKAVLRHELIHAFVREVGGTHVPGWLNEGLAQLQEPPFRNERLGLRRKAEGKLRGEELFALHELEGSLTGWSNRDAIEIAYAQSLAFVAYVERQYSEAVLIEMVAGCARGKAPAETFEERVGISLDVVLEDLARGL